MATPAFVEGRSNSLSMHVAAPSTVFRDNTDRARRTVN